MNTRPRPNRSRGALLTEAAVAITLLGLFMLPIAFAFVQEAKLCRAAHHRAVALEIVDGEMEILAAGEWRAFQPGRQSYPVRSPAAAHLPPGAFALTLDGRRARLEWTPRDRHAGGPVIREVTLPGGAP